MAGCKGAAAGVKNIPGVSDESAGVKNIPGISDEAAFRVIGGDAGLFHCGDRYLQVGFISRDELVELKDPTFDIVPEELTQADSLNGATWHAVVSLRVPAIRSYAPSGGGGRWSAWTDNYDVRFRDEYIVKNGRLESALPVSQGKPFSCSNIPPG